MLLVTPALLWPARRRQQPIRPRQPRAERAEQLSTSRPAAMRSQLHAAVSPPLPPPPPPSLRRALPSVAPRALRYAAVPPRGLPCFDPLAVLVSVAQSKLKQGSEVISEHKSALLFPGSTSSRGGSTSVTTAAGSELADQTTRQATEEVRRIGCLACHLCPVCSCCLVLP